MDDDNKMPYFFLGLGLGVAVGVLFAPKSGEETREFLSNKADEGKDYAQRKGLTAGNAAVRVFRAREALKRRVAESCGACAEHGCLNCTCQTVV